VEEVVENHTSPRLVDLSGFASIAPTMESTSGTEDKREEEEEEEEQFEVEKILNHRLKNGRLQYLMKWKSFDSEENSWEYDDDLQCPEMLAQYHTDLAARRLAKAQEINEYRTGTAKSDVEIHELGPKMVIGAFSDGDNLVYRVVCSDGRFISVHRDVLRRVAPVLICDFLETRIRFQNQ
jgi:hypothetical protein